ncbi:F-box domain [Arabidopsis thaliana x Arabidopsis arenosa]|uniref:F-box domain n=1 Tax=Arabidopsis thaliana x Arabidopsis arenosa TaxID=1240361 RepID=A0A8T1YAG6_9BRAS|nr:F-box domain [Arabidopsis thaliana x Arabidopsis arenosa]
MEKNQNPNTWSELPLDLLNLVFKRLSFANFRQAKSVCSSWYSASKQCVPKNQIPWLMLFPKDKNSNSCTFFNPEDKDFLYKTQDLGVEFAKSVCIATYGSWLLMQDSKYNLYILNPFTKESIDLPSVESQQPAMVKVERTIDDDFITFGDHNHVKLFKGNNTVRTPVFWIDEKTKDYIALWGLGYWCVVYAKKGDKLWNQIPEIILDSLDMVYKDHKLYSFSYRDLFTILDFSGEIPRQTFQRFMHVYRFEWLSPRSRQLSNSWCLAETKLVVTVTGDVLLVERMLRPRSRIQSFNVYKFYSSGNFFDKYELADSLGDEAMLLDLGITVLANEVEGLNRNSIYFSDSHDTTTKDLYVFNYETRKMEPLHKFDFDCLLLELSARWFLPSFLHT